MGVVSTKIDASDMEESYLEKFGRGCPDWTVTDPGPTSTPNTFLT